MDLERATKVNRAYKTAVGIAVVSALLTLWMQGAVATADDSPGPIFLGVLGVGVVGVTIARLRPQGMARALLAVALAQALVAVIAMIAWKQYLELSILNAFFIAMWVGSALLFRRAARASLESSMA
jgi:FtsH-binding integral membrane protein